MQATWRASLVCALAGVILLATPSHAEHTRFWRQSEYSEFEKGTAKGVALRSDGALMPAPKFTQFSDPNLAYVWTLQLDSKNRLYAAGGSNAKVLRFDETGKATTVFQSEELAAQALAVDAHDNLYVGTSPDGKVYKVTPEGKSSVFFEPKTKYIWALAFDSEGTLFVGTGDEGKVFAVNSDGQGQVFYKSEESHARALAFDSKSNLLIGTEPNGLIVRVEKLRKSSGPEAGAAFVIYETSKKEVTALTTDRKGNIFAAAIGEKSGRAPGLAPNMPIQFVQPNLNVPAIAGQQITFAQQTPIPQAANFVPFPPLTGGGEVYRIAPDGSPQSLWNSREDLVYSLCLTAAGKILLGTGNRGWVIELDGDEVFSNVAKTASSQVTSLVAAPSGKILVATANPGKVFTLGPDYDSEGSFESQVYDARIFSRWGRLTWWGNNGATSGKVEFYMRSGNTSNPQNNWSAWAGPYTKADGMTAECPAARFVQWKAVFHGTPDDPASVSWVHLAYLPKNVAPVIDAIVVEEPGIRAQGFPAPPTIGPGPATPVPLRVPQTNPSAAAAAAAAAAAQQEFQQKPKQQLPAQGFAQKGFQTVVWAVHDENDDDLVFTLYYRGEDEKNWRLLKENIETRFYSWDTTTMPDGAYKLKLVASDAPSNPANEALTAERESDRFLVDNTPPRVENVRAEKASSDLHVKFDAASGASTIARAVYSLDGAEWQIAFPVGRLTDSRRESYDISFANLEPGEHTVAVQVFDQFENSTSAKVTFTIPARTPR